MTPGLLVSREFVEQFGDRLSAAEAGPGMSLERIVIDGEKDESLPDRLLEQVEAAFFSHDIRYRREPFFAALERASRLRWLHVFYVGVDRDRYPELRERGVLITNSPGASAAPIALTALGAILWLGRRFAHWQDAQRRHAWEPVHHDDAPGDLPGQTMVLLGVGEIGGRIARHARNIGIHVIGVKRDLHSGAGAVDELHHPSELDDVLPRADWLVIACSLNDETRGLIDARALARLPRGARLLNVSRGAVVDEPALIEALQSGHLGGAYLDVFAKEPLAPDSPLWDLPNVLMTPHNSAVSAGYPGRSTEHFCDNLIRWRRGETLRGIV